MERVPSAVLGRERGRSTLRRTFVALAAAIAGTVVAMANVAGAEPASTAAAPALTATSARHVAIRVADLAPSASPADPSAAFADQRILAALPDSAFADQRILAELPDSARISYHAGTGRVRYLGGRPDRPLLSARRLAQIARRAGITGASDGSEPGDAPGGLAPEIAARAFLERTGPLFGLRQPSRELRLDRIADADRGRSFVRYQQVRDGIPIMGGQLIVQVAANGDVISAGGEALPADDTTAGQPVLAAEEARHEALTVVSRDEAVPRASLTAMRPSLAIFDPRIMGGPGRPAPRLVWQLDVHGTGRSGEPMGVTVVVDALNGAIVARIGLVRGGMERRVCDFQNERRDWDRYLCRSDFVRVEGQPPVGRTEADAAYRIMGDVYRFYRNHFGRDGVDGKGGRMYAAVRYCSLNICPVHNAFYYLWAGQATFGDGWASADDLVAHEFTHGYATYGAQFYYWFQSGALDEVFADVFGELIDLTNGSGNDAASKRWLIGEDIRGTGTLRSMKHPPDFGYPDRLGSPLWWTSTSDGGGVHVNSGPGNKAAYLLTDGDRFNGHSVRALGTTRTAAIFFETLMYLLTSASDYQDLFDQLQQACIDLVGTKGITWSDCKEVQDAVRATEMDRVPAGPVPVDAPVCGAGTYPVDAFFDDLEDPASGTWKARAFGDSPVTWYYPPTTHAYPRFETTWTSSGRQNLFGDDPRDVSHSAMQMTTDVLVPKGGYLRFAHGYSFDRGSTARYDGGIVEISTDGAKSWSDLRPYFTHGGYNGTIHSGRGNPLAGRRAFTGDSWGYGSSRIGLSAFAGRSVRLRFRTGTDSTTRGLGWYIDDIRIYRCADDGDAPTGSVTINGGDEAANDPSVELTVQASDPTTNVTRMRVSNSNVTSGGLLSLALELPFSDAMTWDLDGAYGGSAFQGVRRVYVQFRDRAGNWSTVVADQIVLDTTAPSVGPPHAEFREGGAVAATGPPLPARISWTSSDALSGVVRNELERSIGTGAYSTMQLGSPVDRFLDLRLASDAATRLRFRARARDGAANWSGFVAGAAFRAFARQEKAKALDFSGAWTKRSPDDAYGGSLRSSSAKGARMSVTFNGTDVAIVSTVGPDRGIATVKLDGTVVATVDLYAPGRLARAVVWSGDLEQGAHRIVFRVTGQKNAASTGARVDVDAVLLMTP